MGITVEISFEKIIVIMTTDTIVNTAIISSHNFGNCKMKFIFLRASIVLNKLLLKIEKIYFDMKQKKNDLNSIRIKFIGLQKGEKIHEKLSSSKLIKTKKKLIMQVEENTSFHNFENFLYKARKFIDVGDQIKLKKLVKSKKFQLN